MFSPQVAMCVFGTLLLLQCCSVNGRQLTQDDKENSEIVLPTDEDANGASPEAGDEEALNDLPKDLSSDMALEAALGPAPDRAESKPVMDPVTLEYYKNEPVFSLYLSQMDESMNMTQASIVEGDECMLESDSANLYRSKQRVLNGGCFGDLDDQFDNVMLFGTGDDKQPESFQVRDTSGDKNLVTLKRFTGSKQCETCEDNRCVANEFEIPINKCFFWESAAGSNFFAVVSRTDPMPNIALGFYADATCETPYGNTLTGGGTDVCIGAKTPSPESTYDEGYEFRKVMDDTGPIEAFDISRWIRGTDCKEGFRSNFFGTAKQETVRVSMSRCTKWAANDGREFFVKADLE